MTDSSLGRILGTLVSPTQTFTSIREKPTWVVVLVVLILCFLTLGWAIQARTDHREMIERSPFARADQMSAEQMDRAVEMQERFGGIGAAVGAVIGGGALCLFAAIFLVVFRLFGSEITFKQSFSTLLHGSLPTLVYVLLAVPLILHGGDLTYEQVAMRNVLASNLSFLTPEGAGAGLQSLMIGLDIFSVWSTVLLAIGYRIVARVSTALAASMAVVFFLLGLGLRVGMAVLFS